MKEIDKDNETSTAPITSGLEKKYANHGFVDKGPDSNIPAVGVMLVLRFL